MSLTECTEEVWLAYVRDVCPHQVLDLTAIHHFQQPKAANIKRLEEVGGMQRHTECDNVMALAVELKFS